MVSEAGGPHVAIVFGTRPEAIKLWPVIEKLKSNDSIKVTVINTGQHMELVEPTIRELGIKVDYSLSLLSEAKNLNSMSGNVILKLGEIFDSIKPNLALVQGDTCTAAYGALAAMQERITVGHVEAGLRSYNKEHPFPEEIYRIIISEVSKIHFSPTVKAMENLLKIGINHNLIQVTGNTGIDALKMALKKLKITDVSKLPRDFILITCHRRESHGERINYLLAGVLKFAKRNPGVSIKFMLHLNPSVFVVVKSRLQEVKNITLVEPKTYLDFVDLMSQASLIVTDSGGIQEEAPYLNKNTLVFRKVTERIEGIDSGISTLLGDNPDEICAQMETCLQVSDTSKMEGGIYGSGQASEIILNTILKLNGSL